MKTLRLLLLAGAIAFAAARAFAQTTVSIVATDAYAAETEAGGVPNTGNIQLSRTGSTAGALTVWVRVSGIAVQGVDYVFGYTIGTTIVIPAGSSSINIPVTPIDDWIVEGTEDVRIRVDTKTATGANVPYTISGSDRAIVNIADNEDPLAPVRAVVSVVPLDPVGRETPGGTDPVIFRINRTNNLTPALNVRYSLGGTATQDADYTSPPATITIPAGATFVDVPIVPIDDPHIESAETVIFNLLPTDVTGSPLPTQAYAVDSLAASATGTIYSDDLPPRPALTITQPGTNGAAASGRPFTVNFTASAANGYITHYNVIAGGGTSAFGATNLPASTPDGTPYNGTATVTFTGNFAMALLTVTVTDNHGQTTTAGVSVYVYIAPPDPPQPPVLPGINIYALNAEGSEVGAGAPNVARFRVTHNFPASATVRFFFAMGGSAHEGTDYTLSSPGATITPGTIGRPFTFAPGTTEAIVAVNPIHDYLVENTESVTMSLYTPPFIGFNEGPVAPWEWQSEWGFYYGASPSASVNILDIDTAPPPFPLVTIAATDPVGTETPDGSDPAVFTITRGTGPIDEPLTVNYALTVPPKLTIYVTEVRPAMATNGADFPTLTGTVTIPAGARSADIVVAPTYDLIVEVPELLQITLRPSVPVWPAPGGYVIDADIVADATIQDATLPATTALVSLRVTDVFAYHELWPGRTASFAVTRSGGDFTQSLSVSYTVGGSATNGVDYVFLPGVITIPAGSAQATILVNPYTAYSFQPETVSISLNSPPTNVFPPAYAIISTATMPSIAAVYIVDSLNLSPKQRQLILRRRQLIIPTPPIPPPVAAPAPALTGAAVAPPGPTIWEVQASTNLIDWEVIGTTDPSGEGGDFVDVNAGDFPSRFYRFRELPPPAP